MKLLCLLLIPSAVTAFSVPSQSKSAVSAPSTTQLFVSANVEGSARKKTRQERLEAASKGLEVHCVGLSIHHASVSVREQLAIPQNEWNKASQQITADGTIAEAAVLSTCNRFEVYFSAVNARESLAHVTKYLAKRANMPVSALRQNLFMLSGDDAVSHIMRVSGGLDSLVVGEGQILSQVRQCFLHASDPEEGCGGKVLARLLNNAVAAGKRVRSETAISKGSVSVSSAAVELSEATCNKDLNLPFSEARLTAIGAGEMTRLLITHLASRGLEKITIVNRSLPRAQELQEQFPDVDIQIELNDNLWDIVGRSDIIFTATSSAEPVIDAKLLQENGLAGGSPIMLVDIGVPRNVDADVSTVSNIRAYNVDDLKAVVAKNTALRQREMLQAEDLLKEETEAYSAWRESLSAIPTINQLQERFHHLRKQELQRCNQKLKNADLTDKERQAVERLSRGIVNKLLDGPMAHLRQTDSLEQKQIALNELNAMFRLDDDSASPRRGRRRS